MKEVNAMKILFAAISLALLAPLSATADDAHHKPATPATAGAADLTDGEVRKIDPEGGKVTLKHGAIKNLDMSAMTMVFVAKDKKLLAGLRVGDKVKFRASNEAGNLTVTEIVTAK